MMNHSPSPEPKEFTDDIYSNFDHVLNESVVQQLFEKPGLCAHHYAWGFCATMSFRDGRWQSEVRRYGETVDVIFGDSAREVIDEVCDKWGRE